MSKGKRLLLAIAAALTLHGLLLAFAPGLPHDRFIQRPRHLILSLSATPANVPEIEQPAPLVNSVVPEPELSPSPVVGDKESPSEEPARPPEETPPRRIEPPRPAAKVRAEVKPPRRAAASPSKEATPEKREEILPPPAEINPSKEESPPDGVLTGPAGIAERPDSPPPGTRQQGDRSGLSADVPGPTQGAAPTGEGESRSGTEVRDVIRAVPAYRDNPRPEYPKMARRLGHEGTVVLEVLVGRSGTVEDLRVLSSSGYPVLDNAAMTSVKQWRFEPGSVGGRKVDMWVRVPVRFELRDR